MTKDRPVRGVIVADPGQHYARLGRHAVRKLVAGFLEDAERQQVAVGHWGGHNVTFTQSRPEIGKVARAPPPDGRCSTRHGDDRAGRKQLVVRSQRGAVQDVVGVSHQEV